MAENKKSFILYADLIHTVRKMSKQKAGELFLTILAYVNDENPTVTDQAVDLVFEPVKQQLKRDLVRWEKFKAKQAENGKLGGRPKKGEETQINPNNPSLILETQKSLNATATVNVNVTTTTKEQVYECLRRAAPPGVTKEELEIEAEELLKQYSGKKIGNLQSLCNKWMDNFQSAVVIPIAKKKVVM